MLYEMLNRRFCVAPLMDWTGGGRKSRRGKSLGWQRLACCTGCCTKENGGQLAAASFAYM